MRSVSFVMKSNKIKIVLGIVIILTTIFTIMHLSMCEDIPKHTLQIVSGQKTDTIDIDKLEYQQVTGIRVNGKGEELAVNAMGILLKDILNQNGISEFSKVIVISDDSYKAEVTAEEVLEETKVYILYEEEELRLIVFGDTNSKRSVSNVVQIVVE